MTAGPVDHRRATAERNLASIVDAAEALLHEGATASIAAVATRAGVSRVTVYAHFASREAILEAVIERAVARATVAFDEAAAGARSSTEALERAISASWEQLSRNAAIAEAAAAQLSPDALRRTHEAANAHVRGLFDAGIASGEFRDDVPVEWLVSVCHALLHAAGDDVRAGRLDSATALHALTTTLKAAVAPVGPPRPEGRSHAT
jgi:TetR/AcrR family transcriptional regulator, mexCD-oprJ operon repressor